MSESRYKFFDTIFNEDINHNQKGLMTTPIGDLFKTENDTYYKIPIEYQYRPDLIAYKFYGNSKLSWILTYVNEFSNSPEDYDTDVVIRIPYIERVNDLIG